MRFIRPPLSLEEFLGNWRSRPGYGDILAMAGPLILSTSMMCIQQFIDRMFLCWYSPKAIAAALPAGIFSFTFLSFFIGTASYVNTFVAQYYGARQPDRMSAAVWQSLYFSCGAGLIMIPLAWLGEPLFAWAGHAIEIRPMEITYYRILCLGGGFAVYFSAISGFFTGRGETWIVLWVNLGVAAFNIMLDYAMIFGRWGLPAMGIAGAAWATIISSACGALAFTILFLSSKNRSQFHTGRAWAFNPRLFKRLMVYGLPAGMQFMLDLLAFSCFVFFIGRIGTLELGATNLAFQINSLAFMPMIGLGIATSTLVGHHLGDNQPQLAHRATWLAFHMGFVYMTSIALCYFFLPGLFIDPFGANAAPGEFASLRGMAIVILRFVAIYSVFDTMNLIFAHALKGAGDTRFVMWFTFSLGFAIMVFPAWLACRPGGGGIYLAWTFLSVYVIILGFCLLARFQHGAWQTMRVIESHSVGAISAES